MNLMRRLVWKCLSKKERSFVLERLPVLDRNAANKWMSGRISLMPDFTAKNCIFIHIPKCAGVSVSQALFPGGRPGHLPLSWYESMFPGFYENAFKFTIVRDPLERAYSAYRYLATRPADGRDGGSMQLVRRYPDFDAFVQSWLCPENALRQLHFVPQWHFVANSFGDIDVDYIGRFERLESDFREIAGRLGVSTELRKFNASPGAGSAAVEACSPAALQRVVQVYARDYELFGYPVPV